MRMELVLILGYGLIFSKNVSDETKFNVQIIKDGIVCTFSDEVSKLGTLSSDNKSCNYFF